jgi:glycosyltransferase involved in cell wall biosynthesis
VSRRRRLCMVVHGPYPVGEGRVAREALAAIDAGWEVDVLSMRRAGEPATEVIDGVRITRLPMSRKRGAGALATVHEYVGFTALATAKLVALMRKREYGIVHVHNPPDFLVTAAAIPKALGARIILDIHDFAPELFADRHGSKQVERILQLIERVATRFADAVVSSSDSYQRALEARGVPSDKITVVLNSLDERLLPSESLQPEREGFRVVYHGTVTPHYGLELLAEAAARVARTEPSLQIEIYGDGDAVEHVRSKAAELGVADRFYMSGRFLPLADVLRLVRGARAGVICNLPTEWAATAMPTKLFEYALLGVPIVAADLPVIREYFSPDEVLFFAPGSADSLAEALAQVASDPDAAEARAEAALLRYDEYRWDRSAARYVDLLERLVCG